MSLTLHERFEQFESEYLRFDRVETKLSKRADLHAFILLDQLVPQSIDMIAGADHDVIYLEVEPSQLEKVATDDHILDLYRCGVHFSTEYDCLVMFV